MPLAEKPPRLPPPLPPMQRRIDPKTGLLTPQAAEHELQLTAWREQVTAYLEKLRAAIP